MTTNDIGRGYIVAIVNHRQARRGPRPGKVSRILTVDATHKQAHGRAANLNREFGPVSSAVRSCLVFAPGYLVKVGDSVAV